VAARPDLFACSAVRPGAAAAALARLGLAVTGGLPIDLLASGDTDGTTDAFELFIRLLEQAAAHPDCT
jgi:hypothetical protein